MKGMVFWKELKELKKRAYVCVCVTGKDKAVVVDQSICPKGSESGLTAARNLYVFYIFFAVMLVGYVHCYDRLFRAKL